MVAPSCEAEEPTRKHKRERKRWKRGRCQKRRNGGREHGGKRAKQQCVAPHRRALGDEEHAANRNGAEARVVSHDPTLDRDGVGPQRYRSESANSGTEPWQWREDRKC